MRARPVALLLIAVLAATSGASALPVADVDLAPAASPAPDPTPGEDNPPTPRSDDPSDPLGDDGSWCFVDTIGEPPRTGGPSICKDRWNGTDADRTGGNGPSMRTASNAPPPATTFSTGRRVADPPGVSGPSRVEARSSTVPATPDRGPGWTLAVVATIAALAVPVVWLYRRIVEDEILEHPMRRRIVDLVRSSPGRSAAEIARELDADYDTVRYHVRRLEDCGKLVTRRPDGKIRYFADGGTHDRREIDVLSVLACDVRRRIVRSLIDEEGLYAGEVADRAGIARSTASHHLTTLREAGVVERDRHGNHVRYDIPATARPVVERGLDAG